jgi:hypothetical protein
MSQNESGADRPPSRHARSVRIGAVVGVLTVVAVSLLAAVQLRGDDESDRSTSSGRDQRDHGGSAADAGPGELITQSMVLEGDGHGPELCLGGVLESLPPRCGGPDLIGWDWNAVGGFDSAGGTRWGDYVVIGTYDDAAQTFTVTEPPVPAADYEGPPLHAEPDDSAWHTPCEPPSGGWGVVDPSRVSDADYEAVLRAARAREDYGETWVDLSINPAVADPDGLDKEIALSDQTRQVLNIAVTTDVDAAEADLRALWGGPFCVSKATNTWRELLRIQDQLVDVPGFLSSGVGEDRVGLTVVYDDGTLQAQLDDEYGPDKIRVWSSLRPYAR